MTKRFLTGEYNRNIPDAVKKALLFCSETAGKAGIPIFLIGGIVRDIVINQKNFDVDITVQGNAIEFAGLVRDSYPGICELRETHQPFKTAKICFNIDNEWVKTDLASTRKESYPYPGSLPEVEEIGCELYEDVIRRDFTINAMALSLNRGNFCELVDCLNGYEDLGRGIIRVLHPNSFIDDPTRIIRALKFSVRLGYKLDKKTHALMRQCLDSGRFDNFAGERVKLELKQALNLNRAECLTRFINENIYRLIDTDISHFENAGIIKKIVNEYRDFLGTEDNTWLIYLSAILENPETMENLYMSGKEQAIVLGAAALNEKKDLLINALTRFEIYEFFENSEPESILGFLAKNPGLEDKAGLYLSELRHTTLHISGDSLIDMGLRPGPDFGRLLRETLKAKVNGEISTLEEEIGFVKLKI